MARKLLIIGQTGTGKTYSARNLDPKSTVFISPDEKELPFKGWKSNWTVVKAKADNKSEISDALNKGAAVIQTTSFGVMSGLIKGINERANIKTVIIDTITLAQVRSFMEKATQKGFDKFTDMALEVYNLLKSLDDLRDSLTVIVMAHSDVEDNYGTVRTKFSVPGGKLIGEKIKVEGMFTVVLETDIQFADGKPTYSFITQNIGTNTAKSPGGMFDDVRIENDLVKVLAAMDNYEN